ncbi:NmrA-like oxidoreductase [Abortiporus biennis]
MVDMLKSILVIGATGAQGMAVIDSLLSDPTDCSASPYRIRAFTRDIQSRRAQELARRGVECVEGTTDDESSIAAALQGMYGVWCNVDGFTVGEAKEIHTGIRIFELSKQIGCVRHFVWSSLDYALKKGDYHPAYRCDHYDGKAKVAEWMKTQPSNTTDDGLSWSIVTSSPYMDMLFNTMFGPLNRRADGTFVFATPIGNGHVPMIALSDLGYFARYTFDRRQEMSGKEIEVTSDIVGWDYLTSTFTKVTGQKAEVVHQSLDEWFANFDGVDFPLANERNIVNVDGSTTWRQNFTGWWSLWKDDIIKRDMAWIRQIHPTVHTLESWMREKGYNGELKRNLLKNTEDGKTISPVLEITRNL